MDIPLCIFDPAAAAAVAAGRLAVVDTETAEDHANLAETPSQTQSNTDDNNPTSASTEAAENFRPPPGVIGTVHISVSFIEPSLSPYVVPLSPVTDETIVVVFTVPPTATPQTPIGTKHTTTSIHTGKPQAHTSSTSSYPFSALSTTAVLPLIAATPLTTTPSNGPITVDTITISPPTTLRTTTATTEISTTIIIGTLGGILPSDSSSFASSATATNKSNLLTVGGSTVLAGAVITAGIFLLVRYAMKVRQRRRWATEDKQQAQQQQASGQVEKGDQTVAAVQVQGCLGVIAGHAAQAWGQAGAHHAGFV
ncbi:hypothetical protein QBC44DRAFT_314962 [Cladorrhinum sp. PSN332]|nr:hypothetical protein QBC44DRAFT_314962 [Cladorrhinum sp. PSN332]